MNVKALPFILSAFTLIDGSLLRRTQVASEFGLVFGRVVASKDEAKQVFREQAKFRMLGMSLDNGMSFDFGETMSMPIDHGMSMPFDHGMSMPFDDGMSMPFDHGMSMPFDHGMSMPFDDTMSMPVDDTMSMPLDETMSVDLSMSMPDAPNAEQLVAHLTGVNSDREREEASAPDSGASTPALESNASTSEGLPAAQTAMIAIVSVAAALIALVVVQRKLTKNKNHDDNSVVSVETMPNTIYMTGHHA